MFNFKSILSVVLLLICSIALSSCGYIKKSALYNVKFSQQELQQNLLQENWHNKIVTDIAKWQRHGEEWFVFGDFNSAEGGNQTFPLEDAFSTMKVEVTDFTKLDIQASCLVQVDGRFAHNKVVIFGPNKEIRQLSVAVNKDTLSIKQTGLNTNLSHVVVRMAIANLQELNYGGGGRLTARFLNAHPLTIISSGSGDIIMSGRVNLQNLLHNGLGSVTILGAYTPKLKVVHSGKGDFNIQGRVGISSIDYTGSGDINIVGADSNALTIKASGNGQISINGLVNLQKVTAASEMKIYLDRITSKDLYIYLSGHALLGFAGKTDSLYVDAKEHSFFAGRELLSNYSYLQSDFMAHINAIGKSRAFAHAGGQSSIYIIGKTDVMSSYMKDGGAIIPIPNMPITAEEYNRYHHDHALRLGNETYLP